MIKKVMLSIMMVTAVTLFMVSCNNVAAESGTSNASNAITQEQCYGKWSGTMTVKMGASDPTSASMVAKVSADGIDLSETPGGRYGNYPIATWTEENGNIKVSAKKEASAAQAGAEITFKKENNIIVGYFVVPAMKNFTVGDTKLTKTN